jgi:hypothetical protein
MDAGTITEAQFLLTELQYTLGQLHVQLADMDEETRRGAMCAGRSVEQVLTDMADAETKYQSQYARLLNLTPTSGETSDHVALPVSDEVQQPGAQTTFERLRTHTLELLHGTDAAWTQEVLDLVKQQVSEDRTQTTQIAECRKSLFEGDARPDLDEPLTTSPTPHELAEETGSHLEPGDEHASLPNPR